MSPSGRCWTTPGFLPGGQVPRERTPKQILIPLWRQKPQAGHIPLPSRSLSSVTEMDPAAPGACPLPRLPTSWPVPSPHALHSITHPSPARAAGAGRAWGWAGGHPQLFLTPPDSWTRDPGERGARELLHGTRRLPARSAVPDLKSRRSAPAPRMGPRAGASGGDAVGARLSSPCTAASRKAPGPRPHGPAAAGRTSAATPPAARTRPPAGTPPPSRLPRPRRTRRRRKGLEGGRRGRAGPDRRGAGRGAGTWGRREGTRPRYLLILCAKARRSAAAMAPRVPTLPPPRAPSGRGHRCRLPGLGSRAGRGGAGAGGGALPDVPGRSVLPLPARGALVPLPPPLPWGWGGETEARRREAQRGSRTDAGGGGDSRGASLCHLTK